MDKIKTFNLNFWLFTVIIIGISVLIMFTPYWIAGPGAEWARLTEDKSAHIGDTIGGVTAPFVAIGAALLTFFAFWVQYKFNAQQLKYIERERFENNFYEMLGLHESITNALNLEIVDKSAEANYESRVLFRQTGRDIFRMLYEEYPLDVDKYGIKFIIPYGQQRKGLRELFNKDDHPYRNYETNETVGSLDHYFRQLYSIFKMIRSNRNLTFREQYYYARIARSTLSQYELVLLFYNGLSVKGKEKFKPLIEDFALLKNLRTELLAKDDERSLYTSLANPNIPEEVADYTQRYRKKAFVPVIIDEYEK